MAQFKRTYDFKSVGQLESSFQTQLTDTIVNSPVGIITPVTFDSVNGSMFEMSTDIADQIRDNLKNLISTNRGERLLLEDFGADLKELAYDFTSEDVTTEAINRIAVATGKFMPFVDLGTFEVSVDAGIGDTIVNRIRIVYSVPSLNIDDQVVEVSIVVAS